ncbi:MAG: hypothetical protein ABIO02_02505, partial [Patescibacteria group bacterium]
SCLVIFVCPNILLTVSIGTPLEVLCWVLVRFDINMGNPVRNQTCNRLVRSYSNSFHSFITPKTTQILHSVSQKDGFLAHSPTAKA